MVQLDSEPSLHWPWGEVCQSRRAVTVGLVRCQSCLNKYKNIYDVMSFRLISYSRVSPHTINVYRLAHS